MKGQRVFLFILATTLILTNCSPRSGNNTPAAMGSDQETKVAVLVEEEETPDLEPTSALNPLHIQVTLEETGAVSEIIPVEGGTLQTTAADGTRFTLTLPPNALLSEELITITPVLAVEDLPLSGGMVASLHLAPEGLRLFEPALLVIEPPEPPVSSQLQLIGFAYHGEGEEFHLYPIEATDTGFEVQLMHFSGYGAGLGTQSDIERQRAEHPPSSTEDQAYQNLDPGAGEQAMYDRLFAWWAAIQASLIRAQSDENRLDIALFEFLSWRVLAMGLGGRFAAQIQQAWDYLASAVNFAAQRAHMICVQDRDPNQIARILRWITWAQKTPEVFARIDILRIQEFARKCAQFELDFKSILDATDNLEEIFAHMELNTTEAPIRLQPPTPLFGSRSSFTLQGEGILDYTDFKLTWLFETDCSNPETDAKGGWLHVDELKLKLNLNFFTAAIAPIHEITPPRLEMTFSFHPPPLDYLMGWSCPDSGWVELDTELEMWAELFATAHDSEFIGEVSEWEYLSYKFLITNWEYVGSYETYAQKAYDRELIPWEGETLKENTILILRHKPE